MEDMSGNTANETLQAAPAQLVQGQAALVQNHLALAAAYTAMFAQFARIEQIGNRGKTLDPLHFG
jgi:hypothetical protein